MPATTNHPCFKQPQSLDTKLWRYMDFTKFVSLISSKELFLCRSDLFKDPYEGSLTKANKTQTDLAPPFIHESYQNKFIMDHFDLANWARKWTYISCWHANEFESAAMWDLYAKTDEAIAIETTYEKLRNVLTSKFFIGLVEYIDYDSQAIPLNNSFYPFVFKRKSFEHEKEVRVVYQETPVTTDIDGRNPRLDRDKVNTNTGVNTPVELNELINRIFVSPTASDWLTKLVSDVARKYNIDAEVIKSDLYSGPIG